MKTSSVQHFRDWMALSKGSLGLMDPCVWSWVCFLCCALLSLGPPTREVTFHVDLPPCPGLPPRTKCTGDSSPAGRQTDRPQPQVLLQGVALPPKMSVSKKKKKNSCNNNNNFKNSHIHEYMKFWWKRSYGRGAIVRYRWLFQEPLTKLIWVFSYIDYNPGFNSKDSKCFG